LRLYTKSGAVKKGVLPDFARFLENLQHVHVIAYTKDVAQSEGNQFQAPRTAPEIMRLGMRKLRLTEQFVKRLYHFLNFFIGYVLGHI
jgi:hypothetical protein